ncbi:MAG: hypothetical protein ABS82_01160 [Rhodanobacter sp. SCN 67-45]|nr:MAG: hypothetical protein ABS82_01160 [Rhodanobacter sp. SCN 67-45]
MIDQHPSDNEAMPLTDSQAQARLERMLAARRAAEALRASRYLATRTRRSQFRADVKASGKDMRLAPAPTPRREPNRFTWGDAGAFLLPAALFAAMALFAHWAGWLK